ncbi:LOW QUALITY PROTEIN: hypothetical protein Cgig2_006776 [Carnegiea gigantea]|uniref:Uncharacterized protein n=1 Tax=Carnegiea gigantea TaxID=171969 RepID=A0A9Q1JRY1_9CARY|nr:LOW QUALITY PROTEIN: hypothetical protein Cgig2_006776 [Carnegiea gigantea]
MVMNDVTELGLTLDGMYDVGYAEAGLGRRQVLARKYRSQALESPVFLRREPTCGPRDGKNQINPDDESPNELLAEGTIKGNPLSIPSSSRLAAEVVSTNTSSSDGTPSRSFNGPLRSSSSEGTSTSSSPHDRPATPDWSVLKKMGRALVEPIPEVVVEGPEFPGVPARSNPQDDLGSHFPNPKVVATLKRMTLEKQYLLPAGYSFIIPEPDGTVNEPPTKCITTYRAALNYGLRFPLHAAPKEIGDLGWYCFNNRSGFMTAIEKKPKVKNWKYDFLFVR